MPGIAGLAVDLALDVIEITDPVQSLAGDLGFCGGVDIEEVPPQMGPAGRLTDAGLAEQLGQTFYEHKCCIVATLWTTCGQN